MSTNTKKNSSVIENATETEIIITKETDVETEKPAEVTKSVAEKTPAKDKAPRKTEVPRPRKFNMDDYIDCQSVVYGALYVMGPKSKIMYQWSDYGDITPVTYGDLMSLYSMRDKAIMKPRIKILDDDLVQQWNNVLGTMYKDMQDTDVDAILALSPKVMRSVIENAPEGVKLAIKTIAGKKIRDGELDSLAKIKAIDEVLGTDLRLLAD